MSPCLRVSSSGTPGGSRTRSPGLRRPQLVPLSFGGEEPGEALEAPHSCLLGRRSSS